VEPCTSAIINWRSTASDRLSTNSFICSRFSWHFQDEHGKRRSVVAYYLRSGLWPTRIHLIAIALERPVTNKIHGFAVELLVTAYEYALGSDDTEVERLQAQAAMLSEQTSLLLRRGGIQAGMRVLDLGSGPGDVAFQLADLVGPEGAVLGIEQDPIHLATADRRLAQRGFDNVSFVQADAQTFLAEEPFDAVVCRLLLMHLPAPGNVIAHHLRNLRAGGVFVAVDYDASGVRSLPEVELYSRLTEWVMSGFKFAQMDLLIGMRLPGLFAQAGYEEVGLLGLQRYGLPGDAIAASYYVEVARAAEDAILASGVVSAEEMDLDSLGERLSKAFDEANAVWTLPTVVGSWGRKPS
jgi:SAM-dependent methyltransferase